jgi:uncharacterized surface protein with fasciclin (FAS1) repeats
VSRGRRRSWCSGAERLVDDGLLEALMLTFEYDVLRVRRVRGDTNPNSDSVTAVVRSLPAVKSTRAHGPGIGVVTSTRMHQHAGCNLKNHATYTRIRFMRQLSLPLLAAVMLVGACGDDDIDDIDDIDEERTVWDTAADTASLSTFEAAVEFASDNDDLVDLLDDDAATLTVFAPTNEAFDALAAELTGVPDADGLDLLTPENKPLLREVILYHVLTTEVPSAEIPFGRPIATAQGAVFKIDQEAALVITDGRNRLSQIVTADIGATNGVIHVIDQVLLPPNLNIVQTTRSIAESTPPELTIFDEAIAATELGRTLSEPGPFTVFAPTDAAFAALLEELDMTKQELLANTELLTDVLNYHVVPDLMFAAEIPIGSAIRTLSASTFMVDAEFVITDARGRRSNIITTDILASNGVIHVIDRVLLPTCPPNGADC